MKLLRLSDTVIVHIDQIENITLASATSLTGDITINTASGATHVVASASDYYPRVLDFIRKIGEIASLSMVGPGTALEPTITTPTLTIGDRFQKKFAQVGGTLATHIKLPLVAEIERITVTLLRAGEVAGTASVKFDSMYFDKILSGDHTLAEPIQIAQKDGERLNGFWQTDAIVRFHWKASSERGQIEESLAIGNVTPVAISTIDTTAAVPVTITTAAPHGFETGQTVQPGSITGTVELNGVDYIITVVDATSFTLDGTDGANFTAYVSGGDVTPQTLSV